MQINLNANEFKRQKTFLNASNISKRKKLHNAFRDAWQANVIASPDLPLAISEYKFHPEREWRIDWYFKAAKIAIEIQGGIYSNGGKVGGHNRGEYMEECYDKYLEAALLGILVIQLGPNHLKQKRIAETMERIERLVRLRMAS